MRIGAAMHPRPLLLLVAFALATSTATWAWGDAGHGKGHEHGDGHDHGHEPTAEPTPEQIDKRLARVVKRAEERAKKRDRRQRDRKRALGKRLGRRLDGGAITPKIEDELKLHAGRVAKLRRIRYIAAVEKDYATVLAVDKLLARENARHERWWRTTMRPNAAAPTGSAK